MPLRQLYGGAMSIDIPERFEDISQFRQVPDHQEAFADSNTDSSIIIELNQMEKSISNEMLSVCTWHMKNGMETWFGIKATKPVKPLTSKSSVDNQAIFLI